jgi:hypothetical protein
MGSPGLPALDVSPKQVALAANGQALYVLGSDAIQRLQLENTPPPPQGSSGLFDADLASLVVLVLMAALVTLAVLARRQRRAARLLQSTFDRPVGLHPEDGAQRQDQQAGGHQDLLIAYQAKSEQ